METRIVSEKLKKAVGIANKFVPMRPTLPVLGNIYIKSDKTKLILAATNLETAVRLEIPASGENWEITIPGKLLGEFLNTTKEKETTLSVEKENIKIESGNLKASIAGIASSEFPNLPESKEKNPLVFKQSQLLEAVNSVAFAASVDEGKPVLNGILFTNEKDNTILVATDGYRLAKKTLSKDHLIKQTLLPARIFPEALKVAADMEEEEVSLSITDGENQAIIFGESFQVSTRLIDGVYPQFNQIIPSEFVTEVLVDKEELAAAVKATAVLARDTGNVIKMEIGKNQEIKISANTAQLGESSARLEAAVSGEDLEIAFNSHYLLDGLNSIKDEKLKISFSGSLSPASITTDKDKNFLYIVMPVKAQK